MKWDHCFDLSRIQFENTIETINTSDNETDNDSLDEEDSNEVVCSETEQEL